MARKKRARKGEGKKLDRRPPLPSSVPPPPPQMKSEKDGDKTKEPVTKGFEDGLSEILISDSAWAALEQFRESVESVNDQDEDSKQDVPRGADAANSDFAPFPDYEEPGWVNLPKEATKPKNIKSKIEKSELNENNLDSEIKATHKLATQSNKSRLNNAKLKPDQAMLGSQQLASPDEDSLSDLEIDPKDRVKSINEKIPKDTLSDLSSEGVYTVNTAVTASSGGHQLDSATQSYLLKQSQKNGVSIYAQVTMCVIYVGIGFLGAEFYNRYTTVHSPASRIIENVNSKKLSLAAKSEMPTKDINQLSQPRASHAVGFARPIPLPSTDSNTVLISNSPFKVYRVIASSLNVRLGPSENFPAVSKVKRGALVNARKSSKNGWLELEGGVFISGDFVKLVNEKALTKTSR